MYRQLQRQSCRAWCFRFSSRTYGGSVKGQPISTAFTGLHADHEEHHETPRFAVIGAGLTGLSTAHFLSKKFPGFAIDVLERSGRVGGWLESKSVDVDGKTVIFEQGPQSIRPPVIPANLSSTPPFSLNGFATLHLLKDLGPDLCPEMFGLHKGRPAAKVRYIYYPDHLVRLPMPKSIPEMVSAAIMVLREPLFANLFSSLLHNNVQPARGSHIHDESIGDFFNRRFGRPDLVDNMLSAVFHGIYAGDVYKLSMKSILPYIWSKELWGNGRGMSLSAQPWRDLSRKDLAVTRQIMKDMATEEAKVIAKTVAAYTFEGGVQSLVDAVVKKVRQEHNVSISHDVDIQAIEYDGPNDGITVTSRCTSRPHEPARVRKYCQVISSISSSSLSPLLVKSSETHSLPTITSVTVMLVSLYFRTPWTSLLSHIDPGFGYLIPQSVGFMQNPECALGVIFNNFLPKSNLDSQGQPRGTQLTVMLGGHHWSSLQASGSLPPTEAEGIEMALSVLERHLGIKEKPIVAMAKLNNDCIPQYEVGHSAKMVHAHGNLDAAYRGRLSVVGGSWGRGIGVNDCIMGAWEVVERIAGTYGEFDEDEVEEPTQDRVSKTVETVSSSIRDASALNARAAQGRVTGLEWFVEGGAGSR